MPAKYQPTGWKMGRPPASQQPVWLRGWLSRFNTKSAYNGPVKPDLERKFALLNLLASSLEPPTYGEIFEKLPEFYPTHGRDLASVKKMFERDKDALTEDGFAVVAIVGEDGEDRYVIPRHQGWLKNFQLTPAQAQALREAIEDRAVSGQMANPGLFALKKLLALSGPFDENLRGEETEDPQAVAHFVKAHEALLAHKVIHVDYPNHQGQPETRDFSPYALFFRFGQAFLVVGCHRTKTPKVIALDRVENLSIASKTRFLPRPPTLTPTSTSRRAGTITTNHSAPTWGSGSRPGSWTGSSAGTPSWSSPPKATARPYANISSPTTRLSSNGCFPSAPMSRSWRPPPSA